MCLEACNTGQGLKAAWKCAKKCNGGCINKCQFLYKKPAEISKCLSQKYAKMRERGRGGREGWWKV